MGDQPTIRIAPKGFGHTEVVLDGQDVSELLRRATIDFKGGNALPEVYLELSQRVAPEAIECQAVVHVVREEPADELEAVRRFLEPLDGGELERAALAAMEMGGPQSFGEAVLSILREAVRQSDDGDGS